MSDILLPPLALTMGEPAGIGGEIALAAWLRRAEGVPPFLLLDDPDRLNGLAAQLGWSVPIRVISRPDEALAVFSQALPVLPVPLAVPVAPGKPDARNAAAVRRAIELAVDLVCAGQAAAVVTNPIHKQVMHEGGFDFPGHTEFLGTLRGGTPIMMLACPELRVVPVTVHVSVAEAVRSLTTEAIVEAGRITAAALKRDFALARPRLAVAALNPHAGEGGAMGHEEQEVVAPAVMRLQAEGIDAFGPLPPDTMFHPAARAQYDAALCMYHDQALIPIKTIDFDGGVNVTLGLPFVRTSPDHGTAFNLAGTGRANPTSLMAALRLGAEMAKARSHV